MTETVAVERQACAVDTGVLRAEVEDCAGRVQVAWSRHGSELSR